MRERVLQVIISELTFCHNQDINFQIPLQLIHSYFHEKIEYKILIKNFDDIKQKFLMLSNFSKQPFIMKLLMSHLHW